MKEMKVYRVEIGAVTKEGDMQNWMRKNVLAKDVAAAMKKVKRHGREYIAECVVIATVDPE